MSSVSDLLRIEAIADTIPFATGLFGMLTLMSTMFVRIVKTEIGSLRTEMSTEFRGIHQRIDRLDNDVNALMKHTFGIQRD